MANDRLVIVITGASSGIGAAAAVRLARDGHRIAVAARRPDRLRKTADEVRAAGGEALVCQTDVGNAEAVRALVDRTLDAFGRIDVLFNNAGLMRVGPIEKMSDGDIEQMIRINFLGAVWVVKAVVPVMRKQNSGLIINTSSVLGRKTRATAWVYAGTKWAVCAMTEGLRDELNGTRVRVCAIEPGIVDTALFETFEVHPAEANKVTSPLKPGEVAEVIAFLVKQPWHVNINEILIRPTEQIV